MGTILLVQWDDATIERVRRGIPWDPSHSLEAIVASDLARRLRREPGVDLVIVGATIPIGA